jgi:hypothetical protein
MHDRPDCAGDASRPVDPRTHVAPRRGLVALAVGMPGRRRAASVRKLAIAGVRSSRVVLLGFSIRMRPLPGPPLDAAG